MALDRKPRIRKSAPTLREKVEMERAKTEEPKKRRLGAVPRPRIPSNPVTRALMRVGRALKKVLGWLVPRYFVNSWREVRQVTWPTRRETWRLTAAVFVFAIIFGALVAVVDKGLDEIFKKVILK